MPLRGCESSANCVASGSRTKTLVETLFVEAAPQMTCPICKEKSLFARLSEDVDEEPGDWQTAVLCEICREPIDPERLEAIPGTKRCAACAAKAESGQLDEIEPDYCPQLRCACGSARKSRFRHNSLQARLHRRTAMSL